MRPHPINAAASDGPLRPNPVRCAAIRTGTTEAFWAFGYGALGTRQLETETGITRFSLQTTFGGKEKLFLAALNQYLDISQHLIVPRMTDGSLDTIAHWFEARPKGEGLPAVSCNGCMMIAAMAEFHGDSAAGTTIAKSTAAMVRAWHKKLCSGQADCA